MSPFRVMTYNIWSCRGIDNKYNPLRIAEIINEVKPDLVAIQEIDVKRESSYGIDQPRVISKMAKLKCVFSPRISVEGGEYGLAIMSRYPLSLKKASPLHNGYPTGIKESVIAMLASIKWNNTLIHIVNTHFVHSLKARKVLCQNMMSQNWIGSLKSDSPFVLCGDFNSTNLSPIVRRIESEIPSATNLRQGEAQMNKGKVKTWPSFFPLFQIDHVFLSKQWRVLKAESIYNSQTRIASDHLPLIVDLELN